MFRFFAARASVKWASVALVLLALGATSPVSASDDWLARDKGLHFAVSVPLAAGGYGLGAILLEPPYQRALVGFSFAFLLGVAKEAWDAAGHGQASGRDLVWDALGAATGVLLAFAINRLVHRHRDRHRRATPPLAWMAS